MHGTRADLVDSDGDGISDYDEVNFFELDALALDVGVFNLEETIEGGSFGGTFGSWTSQSGCAKQRSTRGWVEYPFTPDEEGLHRIEIDVSPNVLASLSKYHDFVISIDGEFLSRESVVMESGDTVTLKVLTPWLDQATHTVRLFVDNSYSLRQVKVKEVRVFSATGADSNENSIPDWVEVRIAQNNGFKKSFAQSKTSPVCLEGIARYFGLIESDLELYEAPNNGWYANLDLEEDALTEVELTFENGGYSEIETIEWLTTNLFEETKLILRQGDALKLSAIAQPAVVGKSAEKGVYTKNAPAGYKESVSLTIEGEVFEFNAWEPMVYRFNDAGSVVVSINHTDANGAPSAHEVVIEVVPNVAVLPSPACVVGYEVPWIVEGLHERTILQIDDSVGVFDGQRLETGYQYQLSKDTPENALALARIGYNGPILGSTPIRSMSVRSADETSVTNRINADGTYTVTMPIVVQGLEDDVEVRCEIVKSGVLFKDGSTVKVLPASDFNQYGSVTLDFVMQNLVSNCHRLSVWHNGERIAYLF